MKIKKFRIRPRLGTVGRILKSIMSVKKLPPEIEESLPAESQEFLAHVSPVAFYKTWSTTEIPPTFHPVLEAAGLQNPVAVSALVATVGAGPEEYLSELLMKGETGRSQVMTALGEESADLAFNFLLKLMVDEAKGDECDVSDPLPLSDPSLLKEILDLLEAEQEEILIDSASHLTPRFTRVSLVAWWPAAKKKRLASSKKK